VRPGPYVMLVVSDNGMGMDPETRTRLFEPFFTTKGRGTGLGLSTVFAIVKHSGGNIEVYSEPDIGTSVKIYLPRVDQAAATEAESETPRSLRGSETILLVEDEEMVRNLVRETLEQVGYKLLDAPDAQAARRICETYKGRIHLLITDVVMPKQSGRELAERLTSLRHDMKVLYMSGYTDKAIVNTGLLDAQRAFLAKPFSPIALARTVRGLLDEGKQPRAGRAGT
jgi:two-component system, cell cycle sensor histidine kinase and response regulator CckA